MSLHTLANHLQSAGRGEDKMLVHMTPKEVGGLQSLALAHGGSLTINPETGLPEAGFLSSILPMIAGFALGPAGFALMSAPMAGLAVGAATGLATGSLKDGLMAGLGAYGGAGLGQGLMAQGAQGAGAGAAGAIDDVAAAKATANSQLGAGYGSTTAPGQVFGQPTVNASNIALPAYTPPTPPPPVAPSVTNASAYSPTNTGTPAYAQTPYVTQTGEGYRVMNLTDTPVREAYSSLNPPPMPKMPPGASGYVFDPVKGGYNYYGPGGNPVIPPSAASGYVPSTATTSRPFAGGIQGQGGIPSGATNVSGQPISRPFSDRMSQLGRGVRESSSMEGLKGLYDAMPQYSVLASGATLASAMQPEYKEPEKDKSLIRPYDFTYGATGVDQEPYTGSAERLYFNPMFTARTPYEAPGPEYAAAGGLMGYAAGGQVEQMSAMNSVGANTGYPMANIDTPLYANSMQQRPEATNVLAPSADAGVGTYTGEARFRSGGATKEPESSGYKYSYDPSTMQFTQLSSPTSTAKQRSPFGFGSLIMDALGQGASQSQSAPDGTVTGGMAQPIMQPQSPAQPLIPNIDIPAYQTPEQQLGLGGFYDYMNQQMGGMRGYAAGGGISHLGDYSDGGRLLKGPGDGVSDSIPASIGNRQPARLADGEFVVPARIVSEIGNGSTEAGARKLYAMMDRVQRARRKTVGKDQVARNTKAEKLLPA
jgi:hypothetical protein